MELLLVRHGQSTANADGIWQGRLDFPLSETGREQACQAGRALRGTALDAVYSSPLSRALETATILAREAGFDGRVKTRDGLLERGGGRLEGSTWEERDRTMPELMSEFRSVPEEKGWRIVGAETDEEILARFAPAMESIVSENGPDSRVAVVAHGGVMRAYLRDRFGEGVLAGDRRAANASITRLEWTRGGGVRLVELAGTGHLDAGVAGTPAGQPTSE